MSDVGAVIFAAHDFYSIKLGYWTVNRVAVSPAYFPILSHSLPLSLLSASPNPPPPLLLNFFFPLKWRVGCRKDGEHQEGHPVSGCCGLLTQGQEGQ